MKKMAAIVLCCVFLGGCGVSQADFDRLSEENAALMEENNRLNEELSLLKVDNEGLAAEISAVSGKDEQTDEGELPLSAEEPILAEVQNSGIVAQEEGDKSLYPDLMTAEIKNVGEDAIKSYVIGFLAYDEQGMPLTIRGSYDITGERYEKLVIEQGVNILPGETYKNETGWGLAEDHNIEYLIACVKEVEFVNDGRWENPGYDRWLGDYAEKAVDVETLENMYQ